MFDLRRQSAQKGQNLAEFGLTLPFLLIFFLFTVEIGHAWWTYNAVKMAATDSAFTAAEYHNEFAGQNLGNQKLQAAGITGNVAVTQVAGRHAYQANASGQFTPWVLSQVTMPFVGTFSFGNFNVQYTALKESAVY